MGSSSAGSTENKRKAQASLEMLAVAAIVTFIVGVIMIDAMDQTQQTLVLSSVKDRANYEVGMMIIQNGACAGTRISHLSMSGTSIWLNLTGPCAPQQSDEQLINRIADWVETSYCGAGSPNNDNIISCGGKDYSLHYGVRP